MYSIRKGLLVATFALAVLVVLGLGIYGYLVIKSIGAAGDLNAKYLAERQIYVAIICTLFLLAMSAFVISRSRTLFKEIDKIADLTRHGHGQTGEFLKRLGGLGERFGVLVEELGRLNEMRTLKISSLVNMNGFLIDNMDMKILTIDLKGRITQCSKKALLKLKMEKGTLQQKDIGEIVAGVNYAEIISELAKTRRAVTRKGDLIFYPVFNSKNELSDVICIMEAGTTADELSKRAEHIKAEAPGKRRGLLDIVRRGRG